MTKQKRVALLAGVAAMALGPTVVEALTNDGYAGSGTTVSATVTNLGVPRRSTATTTTGTQLLTGYHAYSVTIATADGSAIGGFDFNSAGLGLAIAGNPNAFHQSWTGVYDGDADAYTYTTTPTKNQNSVSLVGTTPVGWDSYIAIPVDPVTTDTEPPVVGLTASETNSLAGSPIANPAWGSSGTFWGLGDKINGYGGYNGMYFSQSSWYVAYLVIKDTYMADYLNGVAGTNIVLGNGTAAVGSDIPFTVTASVASAIPLPMGVYMGLSGLGMVALYRRNRRTA